MMPFFYCPFFLYNYCLALIILTLFCMGDHRQNKERPLFINFTKHFFLANIQKCAAMILRAYVESLFMNLYINPRHFFLIEDRLEFALSLKVA